MNYRELLKNLGANALLWTGIAAIALTLFQGSAYFLLFFLGLITLNFFLVMLLNKVAPEILKQELRDTSQGNVAFKFSPLKYPKVLDEETREYVPEFIHIDIQKDNQRIFSGNMARAVVKQFSETINQALAMREPPKSVNSVAHAPATAKKKKTSAKS